MNVRVNLNYPIYDGAEIVFKAPCDASEVTGLIVYYPSDAGVVSSEFTFADAHANDLGKIDALFAAGAVVKVIIDTDTHMAFVQNAVTNAYLEEKFAGIGGGGGKDGKDGTVVSASTIKIENDPTDPELSGTVLVINTFDPNTITDKNTYISIYNGKNGKTPVRGTDYWTDADKEEIKSYVDDAILGGAW